MGSHDKKAREEDKFDVPRKENRSKVQAKIITYILYDKDKSGLFKYLT